MNLRSVFGGSWLLLSAPVVLRLTLRAAVALTDWRATGTHRKGSNHTSLLLRIEGPRQGS